MRLGIFGGSFDPIHQGHLILAENCREQAGLDRILFIPAAQSPLKQNGPHASDSERLEMLRLAIAGHEAFAIEELEIARGGTSYTADTLEHLARQYPQDELFLLLGADAAADLPRWHEPARILELALPLFVQRPGSPPLDLAALASLISPERLERVRQTRIAMPQIEISSSDIRRRIAAGHSIRYLTPRAVEKFIETAGLYRGE